MPSLFHDSPRIFLEKLAASQPSIYSHTGFSSVFWVTQPQWIRQILVDSDGVFQKKSVPPEMRFLLGDGTAASDYGPHESAWERLRTGKKESLKSHLTLDFAAPVSQLLGRLSPLEERENFDVYAWCHDFFFVLSWAGLWGCPVDEADLGANRAVRETALALAEAMRETTYFDRTLGESLDAKVSGPLEERKRALASLVGRLKPHASASWPPTGNHETFPFDEERAREFALAGLLLASYENAATVAAWCLWLLAQAENEQNRVFESLKRGEGQPLQAALNETLRLYPAVWSIARQSSQPMRFGLRSYEAGRWFFISPWIQGRSQAAWTHPLQFEPRRWAENKPHAGCFLPFGSGPRGCPGEKMAKAQIGAFLGSVLRRWRFEVVADCPFPEPLLGVTQRPLNGVFLKVLRR